MRKYLIKLETNSQHVFSKSFLEVKKFFSEVIMNKSNPHTVMNTDVMENNERYCFDIQRQHKFVFYHSCYFYF